MYSVEPDVRVRIRKSGTSARIDGPAKVVVRPVGGGRSHLLSAPVSIGSGVAGLSFADGASKFDMGFGMNAEVVAYEPPSGAHDAPPARLKIDGTEYPGVAVLLGRSEDGPDRFDVVMAMSVEDYLPGVIVKEMYAWWAREAFDMQAVCARTYALHERDRARRAGRAFDMESGTLDQVFGGSTTIRAALDAVEDTRGLVLTSRGQLLRAYFSSTCGGRPAAAAEVWPTGPGFEFNRAVPLQGLAREYTCTPSPQFTWNVTRSESELSQRFRAWGRAAGNPVKTMGALRSVVRDRVSTSGRPSRYTVTDDKGRAFSLTAEELRVACNQPADGLSPITKETRVNSGDVVVELRGGTVKFAGRGFGHGVGMCQWCAKGFAEKGKTWREMVPLFYPGAEVVRAF
jgi:stage II sporulation protein D